MKFLVTLSHEQGAALAALMAEDLQTNRTAFLVSLVGAEIRRRADARAAQLAASAGKRPVGRPRKEEKESADDEYEDSPDYSHDTPKNIPHFGRMIGKRELADIEAAQEQFKPKS